jgi:hypothetical protein
MRPSRERFWTVLAVEIERYILVLDFVYYFTDH